MKSVEGKKLLILGGNPETVPLIEVAESLGVKTIVSSGRKTDYAKQFAWKSFDIDGTDVDGLYDLVLKEKIDGVLVGVADVLVPYYQDLCERLHFPCYANKKAVNVFSYKDNFKKTCESYGIHGIPEFFLDKNISDAHLEKIVFPVMVKPVDSGGGVGMTVCYTKEEIPAAVEKALSASKNGRFIVEKFMDGCDDVGIYYTFKDGQCSLSCIFDRYTSTEQKNVSKVNMCSIYPSRHIEDYYKKMHQNALRMFEDLNINNGVLLLTAFYENGEFYVYDPGFRLQGEAPHLLIKSINGFDQREMLIRFALTGSEGDFDLLSVDDARFNGKWASTLWILLKQGHIARIEGLENVASDKNIVANVQRLYEGDIVEKEWIGTEKQVLTRLYVVCNSKKELKETLAHYINTVKVYDDNNKCLCLNNIDTETLFEVNYEGIK